MKPAPGVLNIIQILNFFTLRVPPPGTGDVTKFVATCHPPIDEKFVGSLHVKMTDYDSARRWPTYQYGLEMVKG